MEQEFDELTEKQSKDALLFLIGFLQGAVAFENEDNPITGYDLELGMSMAYTAGVGNKNL